MPTKFGGGVTKRTTVINFVGPYEVKIHSDGARIFGFFLRDARQKSKLSINDLAEAAGVSQSFVSGIECGKQAPSLEVAKRLLAPLVSPTGFEWVNDSKFELLINPPKGNTRKIALKFRSTVRGRGTKDNPKEVVKDSISTQHDRDLRVTCLIQAVACSRHLVKIEDIITEAQRFELYIKTGV